MRTLSKSQQELADLLFTTKTQAKVRRRKKNPDGSYDFYLITRDTSPIDFRVTQEEFVFKHHEQFPDAPLSPMYVNLRSLPENLVDKIGDVMSGMEFDEVADYCSPIPKAANPLAESFSKYSGIPMIHIFDKEETTEKRRIIPLAGAPKGEGKKLLIIDDLITKAASKLEAIKVAEDLGYKVVGVAVLVDREEGGSEELKKHGHKLYAAVKLMDLLKYYLEKQLISQKQFDETMDYLDQSKKI